MMKNWRNGRDDVSPPFGHKDLSPRTTKIGCNGMAITIAPGPVIAVVQSVYVQRPEDRNR